MFRRRVRDVCDVQSWGVIEYICYTARKKENRTQDVYIEWDVIWWEERGPGVCVCVHDTLASGVSQDAHLLS